MGKPVAKLKLLTIEGKIIDAILYCHQETTTVGGTTYYLLKVDTPADASGTTLSASTTNVARVVWGKFVYPLAGIVKILSATIYATYRAYTGGGTVNAEIDILILKADGTVRTTIATGVSKSANLGTTWATYTGANYSFAEYTVVDQTDYLEIDYIANVTVKKAGQYAYLRIDDNTLALVDQTRSQEWKFTGVVTLDATDITSISATLNGKINGTETLTVRGFEWGKQSGNYTNSWTEEGSFPPESFSHSISGLDPDTTYYFRAKAYSTDAGWIYGNELSFHTTGWLTGWSYRKSHVINPASGAGTNYQVRIVAHYGSGTDSGADVYLNGKCRTDFGDVRFTASDGVTLLDYWMETKVDGDYAVFWVEIADDLSSDSVTIYIYYGKSDATTTSNIFGTFPFADDFNRPDSATVGNNWVEDEDAGVGALSIESNTLKIVQYQNYYCHIEKSAPALPTLALHGKIKTGAYGGATWMPMICVYWASYDWCFVGWRTDTSQWYGVWNINGTVSGNAVNGGALNTWQYYRIRVATGTVYLEASTDGVNWTIVATVTRPSSWSGNPTLIIVGKGYAKDSSSYPNPDLDNSYTTAGSSGTHYADDVFVRKYVDPEPSHGSWGSEEAYIVERTVNVSNESVNPTSGFEGDSVTYQATVLDSAGEPLPSSFVADLVMDSIVLVNDKAFTSDVYNPSNGLLTLQFTVPNVLGTRSVRLEGLLTDNAGNPLEGKTLTFKHKLSTETSWTTDGTQVTGSNGKASLTIDVETYKNYDFRVEFAGDDTYEASYDEELNVYIAPKTSYTVKLVWLEQTI
jgi:hypothetical protein